MTRKADVSKWYHTTHMGVRIRTVLQCARIRYQYYSTFTSTLVYNIHLCHASKAPAT